MPSVGSLMDTVRSHQEERARKTSIKINWQNNDDYDEQFTSYFDTQRTKDPFKGNFEFKNTRINNSPYVIVKGRQHLELVKSGSPNDMGFKHNHNMSMRKSKDRPSFLSYC